MKKNRNHLKSLAIELLAHLDNAHPTSKQVELMQSLLNNVSICHPVTFDKRLTEREITCLFLAVLGKTSQETAELLNLGSATVESHRKAIKRKLNCYSLAHAVFVGIRYGYLNNNERKAVGNT